jgi:hypothetical protein
MPGTGCARPRLLLVGSTLLMAGGRKRYSPDPSQAIQVWSADAASARGTDPPAWTRHDISHHHNRLAQPGQDLFTSVGANSTSSQHQETNSYTSIFKVGPSGAVLIYPMAYHTPIQAYAMRIDIATLESMPVKSVRKTDDEELAGFKALSQPLPPPPLSSPLPPPLPPPCAAWNMLGTIVVDTDAPAYEKFAAAELAGQLAEFIAQPPLVVERSITSAGAKSATIAVGMVAARRLFGVSASDLSAATLGAEGFVASSNRTVDLQAAPSGSYALAGTQMVTGPANSSHGTLFAVHHLLRTLGVRYLAHDEVVYPSSCPAALPNMDLTYRPQMEQRNVYSWGMLTHGLHAMRSHQNMGGTTWPSGYTPASYGVSVVGASPPGSVHTSYTILGSNISNSRVPPAELWESHREWFWPRSRKGAPDGGYGQLCWTNRSLLEFVAMQAVKYLRAQPHANLISISQNDNGNYCNDTSERKVIEQEGTPMGPLLRAVNFVADVVRTELPTRNIVITTLAYTYARKAPALTKPRDNVAIQVTASGATYGFPLTDHRNSAFSDDLAAWAKLTKRLYIWDYTVDAGNYILPWPNYYTIGPNVDFFAAHGVCGIFEEGASATAGDGADMAELKNFVLAEKLWDPSQDSMQLIDEFLVGFYGTTGSRFVRQHLDNMHQSVQMAGCNVTENNYSDGCLNSCCDYPPAGSRDKLHTYLTPTVLIASAQALQRGLTAEHEAIYRARLEKVYMTVLYPVLWNWQAVVEFATAMKINDPGFPAAMSATFDRFAGIYRRVKMRTMDGHQVLIRVSFVFS